MQTAGIKNYSGSRAGERNGTRLGWPKRREHKHGSRFRYNPGHAKPLHTRTVRIPAIRNVATREDMS